MYKPEMTDQEIQKISDQASFRAIDGAKKLSNQFFGEKKMSSFLLGILGAMFKAGFDEGFKFATGRKIPS